MYVCIFVRVPDDTLACVCKLVDTLYLSQNLLTPKDCTLKLNELLLELCLYHKLSAADILSFV